MCIVLRLVMILSFILVSSPALGDLILLDTNGLCTVRINGISVRWALILGHSEDVLLLLEHADYVYAHSCESLLTPRSPELTEAQWILQHHTRTFESSHPSPVLARRSLRITVPDPAEFLRDEADYSDEYLNGKKVTEILRSQAAHTEWVAKPESWKIKDGTKPDPVLQFNYEMVWADKETRKRVPRSNGFLSVSEADAELRRLGVNPDSVYIRKYYSVSFGVKNFGQTPALELRSTISMKDPRFSGEIELYRSNGRSH